MALSRTLATAASGGLAGLALYQVQRAGRDRRLFVQPRPEPGGDILQTGLVDRVRHVVFVVDHI